jgi:hypothetical protein
MVKQISRLRLLAIAVLLTVTPAAASPTSRANDLLLSAMSPFEDMTEFALAGNGSGISKTLVAADQQAAVVRKVLPAPAAGRLDTLMGGLHKAAAAKDHHEVARSSVEVFRLLTDNLQARELKVPKEVSLLDYAGYRLRVLAAAKSPDWQEVQKTAGEAAGWWNAVKSKVSDGALRATFDSVIRGLGDAARLQNLPMLRFAAQIDLDLVDLLEGNLAPKR